MTNEQKEKLKIMIGDRLVSSLKQMQREGAATSYAKGVIAGAEWMEQNRWVPTSERLPEDEGEYMVTRKRRSSVVCASFESGEFGYYESDLEEFFALDDVIAWLPNPAPYSSPKPQTNAGTE